MAEYEKPLPRAEDPALTQPFWDAARRHELVIPRCSKCNEYFWYPRQACPNCLQEDSKWTQVSGKASLHTFTVVRQAQNPAFSDDIPYAFAMVRLDEGVSMISNIVECEIPGDIAVDMRLEVVFDDATEDWTLVKFKPA